jgi:hypothetical protein
MRFVARAVDAEPLEGFDREYVLPEPYRRLREVARFRALPARHNRVAAYRVPFGPRGRGWFVEQDFGPFDNDVCDELLARLGRYRKRPSYSCPKTGMR